MKSILSSLMLLFFLAGQVNLTLAAHYCGDELKSAAVTIAPEKTDCCGTDSANIPDTDCCTDEYASSDSDDYFGKAQFQTQLSPDFLLAYVLTIPGIQWEDEELTRSEYLFPDKPTPDLTILYQSFLI
ncbi:hypothetical protein PBT90_04885 [Algoriphagus halophytocola]|uniref:Secreted protein n=1 Tax=Algoriphagus halophytocola TaxID=2991499 RepID=A0ABY6MIE2_9BACT|nr:MULTISPECIES: hypothetical protein [unclassified Algoriphagus]UZD22754.1 hypothetical protein OM944_19145 [Algoriphagus sp. TR-M5]WBL44019.1 hypothetical protein PBT90_04885 [Algoriphagus sp. TR-M9]